MTAPMDDTRSAIRRQQLFADWPPVKEPMPRELKDLLVQLVALEMQLEMHKRGSSAKSVEALQSVMAQPAPDPRCTDPSFKR